MSGEHLPGGYAVELEDKPLEECGVVAIYAPGRDVGLMALEALGALQHRGQESAGIAVVDDNLIWTMADLGLARDVFNGGKHLHYLPSEASSAIGHVRYGTCIIEGFGDLSKDAQNKIMRKAAQPMPGHSKDEQVQVAVGFNGDVPNYQDFINADPELLGDSVSDADIIRRMILHQVNAGCDPAAAVKEVANVLVGSAFSLAVLFKDRRKNRDGIIAVRDPNGFRPFVLGSLGDKVGWIIASESAAIRMNHAKVVRDIEPGEMIVVDDDGFRSERAFPDGVINETFCAMEEIYLMRPDSEANGQSVENMRFRSGQKLARRFRVGKILAKRFGVAADMVVGVPESGMPAAYGYAFAAGLPIRQGLVKNRAATEREFIAPNESNSIGGSADNKRQEIAFAKLVANPSVVEGKRIILVDDSVVRGTTLKILIGALRDAGAKEVHVRIASPPIVSECHYGIDISSKDELIAPGKTAAEISEIVGADSLRYLKLRGLKRAIGAAATNRCYGCMTGEYPTPLRKPTRTTAAQT